MHSCDSWQLSCKWGGVCGPASTGAGAILKRPCVGGAMCAAADPCSWGDLGVVAPGSRARWLLLAASQGAIKSKRRGSKWFKVRWMRWRAISARPYRYPAPRADPMRTGGAPPSPGAPARTSGRPPGGGWSERGGASQAGAVRAPAGARGAEGGTVRVGKGGRVE